MAVTRGPNVEQLLLHCIGEENHCIHRLLTFGATVGNRTDEGRELFRRNSQAAIQCPGPETETLASWAKELSLHIVIGVVERSGGTLYCSSLLFSPEQGLIAKHRKLMPTGSERLIWGLGDGSTMQVVDTELGRIGMAICWENYMPLYRQHLYNQGVQLWCAIAHRCCQSQSECLGRWWREWAA
jgi:nitrilase